MLNSVYFYSACCKVTFIFLSGNVSDSLLNPWVELLFVADSAVQVYVKNKPAYVVVNLFKPLSNSYFHRMDNLTIKSYNKFFIFYYIQ